MLLASHWLTCAGNSQCSSCASGTCYSCNQGYYASGATCNLCASKAGQRCRMLDIFSRLAEPMQHVHDEQPVLQLQHWLLSQRRDMLRVFEMTSGCCCHHSRINRRVTLHQLQRFIVLHLCERVLRLWFLLLRLFVITMALSYIFLTWYKGNNQCLSCSSTSCNQCNTGYYASGPYCYQCL